MTPFHHDTTPLSRSGAFSLDLKDEKIKFSARVECEASLSWIKATIRQSGSWILAALTGASVFLSTGFFDHQNRDHPYPVNDKQELIDPVKP